MNCIFASSKYYKDTKLSPLQISLPLGYDFLNKTKQNIDMPNAGQLTLRQVFDKPHHRVLSQKKTPVDKLQQYLKVSQIARKNQYLGHTFADFMRNQLNRQIFLALSKQFIPNFKPQYSVVQLSQLLRNPRIDSITHIEDYALSKFIFLCEGSDPWRMEFLYQFFNRRIIDYPIQCEVINHNQLHLQQFLIKSNYNTVIDPPIDIQDVQCIKKYINKINQLNKKKDPLYNGIHFYFADYSRKTQTADYFQRQSLHFPLLQYFVTIMSGILGDGQTAVIKLCGAFKHKTFQFIFLLKLIFNGKVSLCKTLGSNPFLPDCYIICEYYNKINGDIIHKYLLQNYNLLKQYNDQKLLLDPKKILRQDLHSNVKNFNQAIIHKGIQINLKQFKNNSNIQYYPSKDKIIQKLPNYAINIQEIVKEMIKLPDKQVKQVGQIEKDKNVKNEEKVVMKTEPRPSLLTGGLFTKKKPNPTSISNDKK